MKKNTKSRSQQQGAVSVLVALTLPVLLGAGALAVDLAYLHVVRNELQNDADAAALAGARKLFSQGASTLNWSAAASTASNAIALNRAAGHALGNGQVQTGYWDTTQAATGLQGLPMTPGPNDAPAVQVTVAKSEGQNLGPVRTFLASIWGVQTQPVRAKAVAGVSSPGSVALNFPVAVSRCMYQNYWDMTAQPPRPKLNPTTQQPYTFQILAEKSSDPCTKGQWTPLNFAGNGASFIVQIIERSDALFLSPPPMLSLGDSIALFTGNMTSIYKAVETCVGAKTNPCDLVVLPVVDQVIGGTEAVIRGFACMKIMGVKGRSERYIEVQMSNQCPPPVSGGIGPNYGVISKPSLFR